MTRPRPARFGWRRLLVVAAAAASILLLATAAILGDPEALALGLLALAGIALLRFRGGLAGAVMLGLLFANNTFWTLSGSASNAFHGEEALDVLIPGVQAAVVFPGFLFAVGLIVGKQNPQAGVARARWVGVAALAFVVVMITVASLAGGEETRSVRADDLKLETNNTAFSETSLSADAGEVGIFVSNRDLFWHTFTIDALGLELRVPVKGERRITFRAKPGDYEFYCRIPGHKIAGMRGMLSVR